MVHSRMLAGVALVSATLLMIELALTRIFSVVMYYHFAFLAISIALFGLSASGVFAYLARTRLERRDLTSLLSAASLVYAATTIVARSEEHTSELQSLAYLVCRLLLVKKKKYTSTP